MNARPDRAAVARALWLALLALCGVIIAHARFTADMSAFLPRAPSAQQRVLVEQMRNGFASRLLLLGIDGADASTRAALSRALAAKLRASDAFGAVENGGARGTRRVRRLLFDYRYALAPAAPDAYTAAGLHRAIAAALGDLASPMGDSLAALLPRDPTGSLLALLHLLQPAGGPRLDHGAWASADGSRALLLLETRARGTDIDAQAAAIAAVRDAFAQVRGALHARGAHLVMSGPGTFAVQSRARIRTGVERVSLLGSVLVVGLLLAVYRSLLVIALGLLPVLSGVVAAVAAVALGFGVVQGVTLGFGTTLIGEAIDYAIYLFVQSAPGTAASSADDAWPTIRLGMLTSVVGFSTLLGSDFPGLAQLGLYSIAGLVAAALVTRFVLPRLLPRRLAVRDLAPLGLRLAGWLPALRRARWLPAALLLPALGVLAVLGPRMWDTRLSALSPIPPAALALDAQLRAQLGAPGGGDFIVLHAATREAALRAAEALQPRLDALVAQGAIGAYDSPARYLPSLAVQRARLAALPDAATLRARLRLAVAGLPVRAERFAPFIADAEAARARGPLSLATLRDSPLALAVDGMLEHQRDGSWLALLPLHAPAHGSLDGARIDRALAGSGAMRIDLGAVGGAVYAGYLRTAIWTSLAGLLAIAALLAIALRSPLRAWRVLMPLLISVILVCAGLLLAGQRLTLLHLVGLMLIVAIGSNYALFFDRGAHGGDGIAPRTLASLLLANVATVLGFGPLALSGVPVLASIGLTVAPGVLLALLCSAMWSQPPRAAPAAAATPR